MTTSHETPAGEARLREPSSQQAPKLARRRRLIWWAGALAALGALSTVVSIVLIRGPTALLVASFPKAEKLITNERAYYDPNAPGMRISPDWVVTSGSLFADNGAGWTGVPDDVSPNAASSNGTDSAVFRAVTRRAGFTDVTLSFQLRISELVTTERTPAQSYDGVHVFLRYQNDKYLYVVSAYRRDGIVAIKQKTPGGPSNGGTYITLAEAPYRLPLYRWVPIRVTIVTLANRAVRIQLTINTHYVLTATEMRGRVNPILAAGRVGLRGDNCEFFFRDFTVSPAAS